MKVRLSVEYEVDDKDTELEELAIEVIRSEADTFAETVKRKLSAAGADVTSFRAEYE